MNEGTPLPEAGKVSEPKPYKYIHHMVQAYLNGDIDEAVRLCGLLEEDEKLANDLSPEVHKLEFNSFQKLKMKINEKFGVYEASDPAYKAAKERYDRAASNVYAAELMREVLKARESGNTDELKRREGFLVGYLKKDVSQSDVEAL